MACSHASGCPLFPKLNASLRGWRDAYCDSDSGWQSCARYTQSLTGQSVPITLLPNGKYAHTMTRAGAEPGAPPRSRFDSLPTVGATRPGTPFEEAPAEAQAPARPSRWDALPPATDPAGRAAAPAGRSAASPLLVHTAAPTPVRTPPTPPTPARESWWTRLVNWMRGPA